MNSYLKHILHSTVFKNMASLGIIQAANYVIPIVIIPFVVRALGAEYFGRASYAQNIIFYLTIIVNYGFEYSATQDIAINRNNKQRTREIFWTVIKFKLLLLTIPFLALYGLYFFFTPVSDDFTLYIFAALINIGFTFFPSWFLQGIEKMGKIAIANMAVKLLGAILIIVFINQPADYRLYILFLSISQILVGLVIYIYVIKHYGLKYIKSDISTFKHVIGKGFPIFLNNIFATLYTASGLTILGLYASDSDVGLYSGTYKIIMAIVMLTSMPISLSLFPMISRKFNESLQSGLVVYKKCIIYAAIFASSVSILTYFAAPLIVKLFLGEEFIQAIPLLRIFSPLPFLIIMASMFTVQGLYGLQLQRYAPIVSGIAGVVCVGINFTLIPEYGMYSAAAGYMFAEFIEIIISVSIIFIYLTKKRRNA